MGLKPDSEDLELRELAGRAGVTVRTIRYYVQQKLLPAPGRGPGTKYGHPLLDRLLLIKRLQREHWPLQRIGEHLGRLDDAGVRRELASADDGGLSEGPTKFPFRLGERRSRYREQINQLALGEPAIAASALRREPRWEHRASHWDRVRLAFGVELNVRRPQSEEQAELVERLIEAAKDIFGEAPQP